MLNISKKVSKKWFTLIELLVTTIIISILAWLSYLSIGLIDDYEIENKVKDVNDFVNDSKYNLIKFKWDNVDIFFSSLENNFKNKYLFSYIWKNNCSLTWWLNSADFFNDIYYVNWQFSMETAYFTGGLDPSISILWYKITWENLSERITLNELDNFSHSIYENYEYKYEIYENDILCSYIFVKKLNSWDKNNFFVSDLKIEKSETDISESTIKVSYLKNFVPTLYTWTDLNAKAYFKWIRAIIWDNSNWNTFEFDLID